MALQGTNEPKPNHLLWAILFVLGTLVGGAVLALVATKGAWVRQALEEQHNSDLSAPAQPSKPD